jgi:purine-binding chemotaxis protein CheW
MSYTTDEITEIFEDDENMEDKELDKYLAFHIKNKTYCLRIDIISDIIEIQNITDIPDMPSFVKGVINLRGKIIPVMDMRKRLGDAEVEYGDRTCIINISIDNTTIGLIVDTVSEVLKISDSNIAEPPRFKDSNNARFISGIGKLKDDNVVIILDAEKILFEKEIEVVKKLVKEN